MTNIERLKARKRNENIKNESKSINIDNYSLVELPKNEIQKQIKKSITINLRSKISSKTCYYLKVTIIHNIFKSQDLPRYKTNPLCPLRTSSIPTN